MSLQFGHCKGPDQSQANIILRYYITQNTHDQEILLVNVNAGGVSVTISFMNVFLIYRKSFEITILYFIPNVQLYSVPLSFLVSIVLCPALLAT